MYQHIKCAGDWDAVTVTLGSLFCAGEKLDPAMRIDTFTSDSPVRYDKQLWNGLCSLRFLDDARGALT